MRLLGAGALLTLLAAALVIAFVPFCPGHDSSSPCSPGVVILVDDVADAAPSVASVYACVGGRCERAFRGSGQSKIYVPVYRDEEGDAVVEVTLRDRRKRVLTRDRRRVALTLDAPNGEDCPPKCFSGQARVDARGRLRPASRAAIQ